MVSFGTRVQAPNEFPAGQTATLPDGAQLTVNADGSFQIVSDKAFESSRGQRIFYRASLPPRFTLENYQEVLQFRGHRPVLHQLADGDHPRDDHPDPDRRLRRLCARLDEVPGRALLLSLVVGLLVVPLQMSLIPLLSLYNGIGQEFGVPAKTYVGIWLAHTGFGLPLAIYLLRNYIAGLPREIMESARIDGASDFDIFVRIVLPLSLPALASFSIFQFLWVWNDLLVAIVFLGAQNDQLVLTARLVNLLGSRGSNWEILTASAFITILVPLIVFLSLQRFLIRGMLSGSVKG